MNPGNIIKLLRTVEGLSQEDLAEKLGISRAYLSQVENGKQPGLNLLKKAAKAFNVPAALFIIEEDEDWESILKELRSILANVLTARVKLDE